jgi:hypothetical protein
LCHISELDFFAPLPLYFNGIARFGLRMHVFCQSMYAWTCFFNGNGKKISTESQSEFTLLAVELRRNHCKQTNDFLSSMREDHVVGRMSLI